MPLRSLDEIRHDLRTFSQILRKLRVQISDITRASRRNLRGQRMVTVRNRNFANDGVSVPPAFQLQVRRLNDSDIRGEYQVALRTVDLPPQILATRASTAVNTETTAPPCKMPAMATWSGAVAG